MSIRFVHSNSCIETSFRFAVSKRPFILSIQFVHSVSCIKTSIHFGHSVCAFKVSFNVVDSVQVTNRAQSTSK